MFFYLAGEVLKPEVLHMCKISGGLNPLKSGEVLNRVQI